METDPMLREYNERSNMKKCTVRGHHQRLDPTRLPEPRGEADFGGDQLLHEAYYFCCNWAGPGAFSNTSHL